MGDIIEKKKLFVEKEIDIMENKSEFLEKISADCAAAVRELIEVSHIGEGDILVVGCSSSEIMGETIGHGSTPECAEAVYRGIESVTRPLGIFVAAQCCEHLNRALIVERAALSRIPGAIRVNVVPQIKAGGSFATAAYGAMSEPVAVEHIKADAGLDIGSTLIGMHLGHVAVPVRLKIRRIGDAPLTAARVRLPFIGGSRAVYDETLM